MNRAELEDLYDRHAEALYRYLLAFLKDETDTRDVLQNLLVKVARNPTCLEGVAEPKHFLFRMAHNLAVDWVRRAEARRRKHDAAGEEAPEFSLFEPADDPDRQRFENALSKALGQLPEDQRTVVYLRLFEDQTFAEIADLQDVSLGTTSSRYRYGIEKLQEQLRPLYEEIQP